MTDADLERLLVLDAAPGPAHVIEPAESDAIVEAALAGAGFGPGGGGGSAASGTGAKLAIVGGAALAVIVVAFIATRDKPRAQVAAVPPDAAMIDAPTGNGSAVVAEDITIEPTAPVVKREAKKPAPAQPTVDDLLGEANAKRAEKQWRESDILYGRVVERAPKSLAAQTALVASGSLHLEHLRDPRGAAKQFRRALELAPSGAVAEDARWGLAEAARALRDDKAEAAALDDFIAHHATSPLASRAKARRAELP